jgi:hypothetical protein
MKPRPVPYLGFRLNPLPEGRWEAVKQEGDRSIRFEGTLPEVRERVEHYNITGEVNDGCPSC